jgi:hypothetical protein
LDFEICLASPTGFKSKDGFDMVHLIPLRKLQLKEKELIVRLKARRDTKVTKQQRTDRHIVFTRGGKTK